MLIGLLQVIQDGWEGACQIGGSFLLSTADTVFFWFSELPYILIYGGGCCICSSEPHGVKEIHTKLVNQWMKENPDSISEPKERRTRLTSVNQLVGETQFQTVNLCG